MTRGRTVGFAALLLLGVFASTHAVKFPGSLAYLMEITQGQKILDMQPSFSENETYQRLAAFGELGRQMYMRTILTIDIVFPLTVFLFLFLWGKFSVERAGLRPLLRNLLLGLSICYVVLDFLENASILAMLFQYPERIEFLGNSIGYLTRGKRFAMLGAMVVPALLLLVAKGSQGLRLRPYRR